MTNDREEQFRMSEVISELSRERGLNVPPDDVLDDDGDFWDEVTRRYEARWGNPEPDLG